MSTREAQDEPHAVTEAGGPSGESMQAMYFSTLCAMLVLANIIIFQSIEKDRQDWQAPSPSC
jgi:hypothetical protein